MTSSSPLFQPLKVRSLELANRIVMSPMTRSYSIDGIPGDDVAGYYRRRAEGGTGLIVTEGVAIDHETAVDNPRVPRLFGEESLAGWRKVVDGVHEAGGKIIPQLWHVGPLWGAMSKVDRRSADAPVRRVGPARHDVVPGVVHLVGPGAHRGNDRADIQDVIAAFARAARNAIDVGFDGISPARRPRLPARLVPVGSTNKRDDEWGGDLERRTRFPVAVVKAIRAEIGEDYPIFYRFSQHKQQNYTARIAETPDELKVILGALADAGVDVFDASIRRFDIPAFEGSDVSLAGWAKKVTGAITMAVGSVGIGKSLRDSRIDGSAPVVDNIPELEKRIGGGEFDLIAIGRLHLADPALASRLRAGEPLPEFVRDVHEGSLT
nr:12-oxophytodienoate reductase [Prescottella equi]